MGRTDFEPARYVLKRGMTVKIDFDININIVLMILYCKGIFISVTIQIYNANIFDALFFLATNYVKALTTTPTSFTKERQT